MKLQRIEIENFSSYYGKNEPIELSTNAERPLIIFVGKTGFGKTSMFDAINWALYGEEFEKDVEQTKERTILDYVNETALSEAARASKRLSMTVTLFFEHQRDQEPREYYITQTLVVAPYKQDNGTVTPKAVDRTTSLLREITPQGDHVTIPYTRTFLDEILPNNVKSYFLFDGDRIHNLAKPGNSQEVQDAIYRVVDLEIIRNAAEHLSDAALEYGRRAAKSAEGELAQVEKQYHQALDFQQGLKAHISDIKKERRAIQDQVARIDSKLENRAETSGLKEQKKQFTESLSKNLKEQQQAKNQLRSRAAKAGLSLAMPALAELQGLLKEKRAKGEIPRHIRQTFFDDLFQMQECICGTHFKTEDGDAIYEHLKQRLAQEKDRSAEEDHLIDLYHQLTQATSLIRGEWDQLKADEDYVITLEEEARSLMYQSKEIDTQLGDVPIEHINVLVRERQERDARDKQLVADLATKEEQLKVSEKELKSLEGDRKALGKRQEETGAQHLRSELAKAAADQLNRLYDDFAEQSRQDVETLTIEEFKAFVFSSSNYRVALSRDYSLEVLDANGNRALQRLSMGQSQCLSLAFITAIARVSKKQPPLVIDMPFSRLDHSVHQAISQRLPDLAQQTILFLIPKVEWNETTQPILSKYAQHIYEMNFDEQRRQTSITALH